MFKAFVILCSLAFANYTFSLRREPSLWIEREPKKETSTEVDLDEAHEYLSQTITGLAQSLDSYFGDYIQTDKVNKTRLTIETESRKQESSNINTKFDAKLRLNLPYLEELLKFKVKKQGQTTIGESRLSKVKRKVVPKIEIVKKETDRSKYDDLYKLKWKLSTQVGLDLSTSPDVFIRLNKKLELSRQRHLYRLNNQFAWSGRDGFIDTLSLDFDLSITQKLLFRIDNSMIWKIKNSDLTFFHGPILYYNLARKEKLSLYFRAYAKSINDHRWVIDRYESRLEYSARVLREWILLRTGPTLSFKKDENFKPNWSYLINFQVFIGKFN